MLLVTRLGMTKLLVSPGLDDADKDSDDSDDADDDVDDSVELVDEVDEHVSDE